MVVDENDCGGKVFDGGIEALARMDYGLVDEPFGYVMDFDDFMSAVKRNSEEVFLPFVFPSLE